jgi:rhamnulokinase
MRVLAVDLGAGSVRVAAIDLGAAPAVEVIHRWPHGPVVDPSGALRWDWERIVAEVETGLEIGIETGAVESIGVDGWGVDYGLGDGSGRAVAAAYSYRDSRTDGWMATAEVIGLDRLYEITGIQLMGINTIFQLAAHDRSEIRRAARLLLLPDLLVSMLTGFEGAERSNASTTGLLDARTGDWSGELIEAIGMSPQLLPPVTGAGQAVGKWRGVPLHLVGSHDTASAFLGVPGGRQPGTVFVSTGSWVIVGIERTAADTSPAARGGQLLQRVGRTRWVPLPEERGRTLDGRGVPAGMGEPACRSADQRSRRGHRSGATLRWLQPTGRREGRSAPLRQPGRARSSRSR